MSVPTLPSAFILLIASPQSHILPPYRNLHDGFKNMEEQIDIIKRFLIDKLTESDAEGYVVGLSGGIDSAVSATLAVAAVGKERVVGVMMPYKTSSPDSLTDAGELAGKLSIEHRKIDISPMIDAYYPEITKDVQLRAGNKMARERMSILFDIAFETNRLVLGTGNRTEICLGYTTWYGDAACSVNPIGQLYKQEIFALAARLDVPPSIRSKAPSADLWTNQTDEDEIGLRYEIIDRLLGRIVDDSVRSMAALKKDSFNEHDIERVVTLLNRNAFKRRMPDIPSLGRTAIPDKIEMKD